MVRWRMMFCEIVIHIRVTRHPTHMELVMLYPIFDPVESHVRCIGAFPLDCVVDVMMPSAVEFSVLSSVALPYAPCYS
jgi:hypothetical protein